MTTPTPRTILNRIPAAAAAARESLSTSRQTSNARPLEQARAALAAGRNTEAIAAGLVALVDLLEAHDGTGVDGTMGR